MGVLTGKVAIVTGAASGVGRATTRCFAREGASVLAADLNESGLVSLMEEVRAAGGTVEPFQMDVSDRQRIIECFAFVRERFGRLDVLVNNAGMSSATGMPTREPGADGNAPQPTGAGDDPWEKGISTTLSSLYWISKSAVEMMTGTGGAIVNVASTAGNFLATPVSWYCAAKAGVVGLTNSFAGTYGKLGIRTNALLPGAIDTPRVRDILDKLPGQEDIHNARHPLGRMASADEIAACILFLASDASSCVNGAELVADGGYRLVG